jgi:hypothetical protein
MAHKWIGGLLAAATMLTPLAPAYAAGGSTIGDQIGNRIVLAQRDDRRSQRADRSTRAEKRGERTRGEARRQPAPAAPAEARRERRDDRQQARQTRRGDPRTVAPVRVAPSDYRRDDRQGNRPARERNYREQQQRPDYRRDQRPATPAYRGDRSGAAAVDRYRDQRRADQRRYDRRDHDRRDYERRDDRRDWNRDWRSDRRYDYRDHRRSHRSTYRLGRYYAPYRDYRYRRLNIGFSIGSLFYGNRYWINDPYQYRLPPAYYPYRWVRYYDDALLVDTRRGRVVDVIYGVFW